MRVNVIGLVELKFGQRGAPTQAFGHISCSDPKSRQVNRGKTISGSKLEIDAFKADNEAGHFVAEQVGRFGQVGVKCQLETGKRKAGGPILPRPASAPGPQGVAELFLKFVSSNRIKIEQTQNLACARINAKILGPQVTVPDHERRPGAVVLFLPGDPPLQDPIGERSKLWDEIRFCCQMRHADHVAIGVVQRRSLDQRVLGDKRQRRVEPAGNSGHPSYL